MGGLSFDRRGYVDPDSLRSDLVQRFANSSLNGHVPPDGAAWGITTGSPDEWARFGVALAKQESGFNPRSTNLSDPGGSFGIYQFNQRQFGLNGNAYDPSASADAFVKSVEHYVPQGGIGRMGAIFGSVRRPWEGQRHLAGLGGPAVSQSVASASPSSTPMPGPRPMAQDYTGQYIPEDLIRQRQQMGQQYWNTRPSGGKFSLAEGLMAGLGSTIGNSQAADAILNNQRVRTAALSGTPTLSSLLQSGIPEYQDMAAKTLVAQSSPQAQIDLERSRMALENDKQAMPLKLETLRTEADINREKRPLELEKLKADIAKAKQADEINSAIGGMIKGALAQSAQPQAPAPKPLGEIIPQAFDGDAPMPGVIKTADGSAPAPAQPKAPDSILANIPPDQRRKVGEAMLLNPTTKALGEQLLKEADKGDLEKASRTELEKKMLGNVDHLARLGEIEKSFNPDYLTMKFRIGQKVNALGEVFGQKLKPEDQKRLASYTAFRSDVARNFNLLLKEASGTAVTESEYKRMQLQEPSAGDGGWFDHFDSPTEFQAKLKQSTMALKLAIARQTFLRNRGGDPAEIAKMVQSGAIEGKLPLGGMKKIIDNGLVGEQKRLLQANPNMPPDELSARLRDFGKREYGI